MADLPPDTHADVGADDDAERGMPRWVKAFVVVALVAAVLVVILLLTGGEHGPGRHRSAGDTSTAALVSGRPSAPARPGWAER